MADQRKQMFGFKKPEEGQEMQELMTELKERKEQRREGPLGTYKVINAAEVKAVREQARKTMQEI